MEEITLFLCCFKEIESFPIIPWEQKHTLISLGKEHSQSGTILEDPSLPKICDVWLPQYIAFVYSYYNPIFF